MKRWWILYWKDVNKSKLYWRRLNNWPQLQNLFALNVFSFNCLNLILNDNKDIDLEKNDFIGYINKIQSPGLNYC